LEKFYQAELQTIIRHETRSSTSVCRNDTCHWFTSAYLLLLPCLTPCFLLLAQLCSVLFCSVLLSSDLFCSVPLCSILFSSGLFCSVLFWSVLFCPVPLCSILFSPGLFCSVLFCSVLFCSAVFCSVCYIRQSDGLGSILFKGSVSRFRCNGS
jgi:hypothetical protein